MIRVHLPTWLQSIVTISTGSSDKLNSIMQVLEMEEVESLVGNANRKRLNVSRNKNAGSKLETLVAFFNRSDLLSKMIVAACTLMLAMLYISAQNGGDVNSEGGIALKTLTPADKVDASRATTSPPPVPDEVVKEAVPDEVVKEDEAKEDNGGDKNNDAYLYSKYATIVPLVDHPFPSDEERAPLREKFGKWGFYDGDELERPMEDYASKFPNRDIPGDQFPRDAWQADAVYVNHILNDADLLILRTMEAIFVEYGHGKPLPPEGLVARMKMFHWSREDLSVDNVQAPEKYRRRGSRGNGGWTTKRSFDGLVRRLLHAMMTQDTFTVVMGGHSAAMGAGNNFRQSYMMQFHKIMYPIFARLGVKLVTRNVGQGGLGTLQAGMGSGSIYGDEIDLLLWDSGMTETEAKHIDIFFRQAILAGKRVPVLWGGRFELLKMLHEEADVDVGEFGLATDGIIEIESLEQAKDVPWAARFMKCKPEVEDICKEEPRFCAKCWIDRKDNITPEAKQLDKPRGQVKWHGGWRVHQLTGRNIAFGVLEALQAAINIWTEGVMGGPPLDDDLWHVTDYYENIRNKVKNLDKSLGSCYEMDGDIPTRFCNTPMKARAQYTPRANPNETSLTSIIKPTADGYVPKNEKTLLYEGPDEHNTCLDIPEGELDVFNVVTGRRRLNEESPIDGSRVVSSTAPESTPVNRVLTDGIIPGKGWEVWGEPPGLCDGTYDANCGRWTNDECAMSGHHDARGAVIGNEYSGWLVMTLKDLKEGVIVLKLHTWQTEDESTVTKGWTSVDNVEGKRRLGQSHSYEVDKPVDRMLMRSYDTPGLPDEFAFEYAIDGVVTTLTKDQFLDKKKQLQRVVETITILDDPNFTSESKDVEIAIRLRGSGRSVVFGVSHVYWA